MVQSARLIIALSTTDDWKLPEVVLLVIENSTNTLFKKIS
jgi:hypothetical protein